MRRRCAPCRTASTGSTAQHRLHSSLEIRTRQSSTMQSCCGHATKQIPNGRSCAGRNYFSLHCKRAAPAYPAGAPPPCSEHELTQHHTEDKNDQENDDRNEEQDFGNRARARRDSGKTEETGNDGNDEENDGPFDHGDSLARVSDRAGGPAQLAYLSWDVVAAG